MMLIVLLACGKKEPAGPTKEQRVAEMKQTLAPIIEKNRAATTTFLAGLRAVGQDSVSAPPVTAAVPLPPDTKIEHATTLKATPSWFAGVKQPTSDDIKDKSYLYFGPGVLRETMQQMLDTGIWNEEGHYNLSAVESTFEDATRFMHAIAVRVHTYKPADARAGGFTPATASGDVLLYSMPDGKRIGAFPFEIVQKVDSVSARAGDADKELAKDFRDELGKTLDDELIAFSKGTGGAAAPGVAAKANVDGFVKKLNLNFPGWALGKNIIVSATASIEAGPTVVFKTDNVKKLEEHRAELTAFVEETLGTPATIRIEER
jgi:hypothetical protein